MLDVVIATAVRLEFDAVKLVLKEAGCEVSDYQLVDQSSGTVVGGVATSFTCSNKRNETSTFNIGVFQLLEMGGEGAADFIHALNKCGIKSKQVSNTAFIVMVGMCAGNPTAVRLGDIMTPYKITKLAGKKDLKIGSLKPQATYAEVTKDIQRQVQAALPQHFDDESNGVAKYLPRKVKNTPTPLLLQDSILRTLKMTKDGLTLGQLQDKVHKKHPCWESNIAIEEAVGILRDKFEWIEDVSEKLKITPSGEEHLARLTDSSSNPARVRVHDIPMTSSDHVQVGMAKDEWEQLQRDVAQGKLGGLDMEGYTFLRTAQDYLPLTIRRWFVKVVTDYATVETKMKYYQEYGTCLAASYLLHVLEVSPGLASRR